MEYFHHVSYMIFHHLRFGWRTFNYVILLCPLLLQCFNGTQLWVMCPTTDICLTAVDENVLFVLPVWLHLDRKLT